MKTGRVWLIVGIIGVLVVGSIWFAVSNKDDMPSYSQPGTSSTSTVDEQVPATTQTGQYVDYNEQVFANTQGRRWLFFHAGWCPQCRALEKDIQEKGVPDGVTIFKVNYDADGGLKKQYGVTLQTTIVEVDGQGNEIQKFVAYDDPTLQAVMNALGD